MAELDHNERDAFGHWISGFTDGEGCFRLYLDRGIPHAIIRIGVRSDDGNILTDIKNYWNCGTLYFHHPHNVPNARPQTIFSCAVLKDLANIIVPHFDKYPLRAKKKRDFLLWKQGVLLLKTIRCRPRQSKGIGFGKGTICRYTPAEIAEFSCLCLAIKTQRCFDSDELDIPVSKRNSDTQSELPFDHMTPL